MKIVSNYLESITGIEIYPIISFLIFFIFFVVVTWMVIKMDKEKVKELENYPLDSNRETQLWDEISQS